ncbi:MAG: IPT/TIG domain-containing protein [Acidobacteria bacterium]|nr:IPT/TIG domain-containing protein [Acidobacteriota bacterium]
MRNADGRSVTRANGYTYDALAPEITTVSPSFGPIKGGTVVTISGKRFSTGAVVRAGAALARVISVTSTTMKVTTPAHLAGAVDLQVVLPSGLEVSAADAFTFELDEDAQPAFVRYFAEGASGSFFSTRFALANPHDEQVAVTATFTDTAGGATSMELIVPAMGRATIDESNRPALGSEAFATRFDASREIGIDRTMEWAAGGVAYGAHSETGIAEPRTSWVVAEGATIGGFNLFYLLQNPTDESAEIKVTYLLATGQRIEKVHSVAAQARTNIWVNKEAPMLESAEMSATFTSLNNVPVVVERSMYRNVGGQLFTAGHNSAAIAEPALRWFLAEGATGGTFDTFVLIGNPNATEARLRVSYLRAGAAPLVKEYVAAPQSRLTLWVDEQDPVLANAEVSTIVESTNATPVVVERAMWWRATPEGEWTEAHNSAGVTRTAARWVVADGSAGGDGRASTYVLVANTGLEPAPVKVTLLSETGPAISAPVFEVDGQGRFTIDVAGMFPQAANRRFSVLVESTTGAPLVVERATYSDAAGVPWAAGTNSLGMPLPARTLAAVGGTH